MADPVLHIKDAYYFEIPKFMWRYHYQDYSEVPSSMKFLVDEAQQHHHLSIEQFNQEMSGKILIPQPFATLKNLHEPAAGFAISKFMVLELMVAVVIAFVFIRLANRMSKQIVPQGRGWNMLEAMLVFIRNDVVRPSIGDHSEHEHSPGDGDDGHFIENVEDTIIEGKIGQHVHHHSQHRHELPVAASTSHPADKFLPLFWTMFFFILVANLFGLLPWLGSPTGSFGATFALACVTLATTFVAGMFKFGPLGFWFNQVPSMDLPWFMAPLKGMIFLIEVLGLFIKHAILAVRLLANMVAGHLVLLGILGLILGSASSSLGMWSTVTVISVISSTLFSLLELMVAFLQAYIFTFLSALFIGAAVHKH